MTSTYHLAQVNIARMRAPLDSPVMADFVANLDGINALAEASPGFVWRLKGEGNDATDLRPFDETTMIVNLSVWESVEALMDYAFRSDHAAILRRRREWFVPMSDWPSLALWWIPAGTLPTVAEARAQLERLRDHGTSPEVFTFRELIEKPGGV